MTARKFAVFDIDGTLIRWQLYHAVVNRLAKDGLLGSQAYEQIRQARMSWKSRSHPEAFKDYERATVAVFDKAVLGLKVDQFRLAAEKVVEEYRDQTYVYTRQLIKTLKEEGCVLLAISGSQQELVELLARHYGFNDWVGSIYVRKHNRFTGEKKVAAEDKADLLDRLVSKHNLTFTDSLGVGDTASDIGFLAKVERPIAFNPDRHLYREAVNKGWPIVVERKNVIYRLEAVHGRYQLAAPE